MLDLNYIDLDSPRIRPVVAQMTELVRKHVESYQSDLEHDFAAMVYLDEDDPFIWAHRKYGTEFFRPIARAETAPFLGNPALSLLDSQRAAIKHWSRPEHETTWYMYTGAHRLPTPYTLVPIQTATWYMHTGAHRLPTPYTLAPTQTADVLAIHNTYLVSEYREYRLLSGEDIDTIYHPNGDQSWITQVYNGDRTYYECCGVTARTREKLKEILEAPSGVTGIV